MKSSCIDFQTPCETGLLDFHIMTPCIKQSISPYSVRIRENAGKMRTRISPNTNIFYAVIVSVVKIHFRKIFLKVIGYRDLNLVNETFMSSLQSDANGQNYEINIENPDIFFRRFK